MTEEELLGFGSDPDDPFAGPPIEHPAGRYPVCLGTYTREEAEDMSAVFDAAGESLMRQCWIDLETRTLHHVPGCRCIRRADGDVDCAGEA